MDEVLLEIQQLSVNFNLGIRSVSVLDNLNLKISRGKTHALVGESGCGKSLTASAIMRLLPGLANISETSAILFDRQNILHLPEYKMRQWRGRRISMIFQEPMTSLNPVLKVNQQISEVIKLHFKKTTVQQLQEVTALLHAVGIPDPHRIASNYPHQLSGGMKQRVMIAMALAGKPELLIADEPTTALDVTIQAQVLALMQQLQQQYNMAILLITHDLGVVRQIADDVSVMYAGQIVEQAPVEQLFTQPRHPYTQGLFAAIPTFTSRDQPLASIEGIVPSLGSMIKGCRFADRCRYAWSLCHSQQPELFTINNHIRVRCHLYDESATKSVTTSVTDKTTNKTSSLTEVSSHSSSGELLPLLSLKNVHIYFPATKSYFKRNKTYVKAINDVSFTIKRGSTVAIVGESGCGKTTLARSILRLIDVTSGVISYDKCEITRLKAKALHQFHQQIQIIFQDPFSSMNPRMTIGEIVAEGLVIHQPKLSTQQRRSRVEELLQQVGLSADCYNRYPHEFSGGQRQRISIARALAVNPQLIICDEPTSALDVSVQAQILNLLRQLQHSLGITLLFITHNIGVVSYIADEVMVMYLGKIVEHGHVKEILHNPKHPYTQSLLASVPSTEQPMAFNRLAGEQPSLTKLPRGCYFHPRCPHAMRQCKKMYPQTTQLSKSHTVNCFLYG
ncbi:MAG: ABC transporter ATP-binding protein [Gammaproteobacteria bacterium]